MNITTIEKQTPDVTVYADGSTTISQRKLAEKLGVNVSTLKMHIARDHQNTNTSNGLDENTAFLVTTYFAYESKVSTQMARDFIKVIGAAGIRAYNYHEAGYALIPSKTKSKTPMEILRDQIDWNIAQEKKVASLNAQVNALEYKVALKVSDTAIARNSGFYSLQDCKNQLELSTGASSLKLICDVYNVRRHVTGTKTYYYLSEVNRAIKQALKDSEQLSPKTFKHPSGFKFRF